MNSNPHSAVALYKLAAVECRALTCSSHPIQGEEESSNSANKYEKFSSHSRFGTAAPKRSDKNTPTPRNEEKRLQLDVLSSFPYAYNKLRREGAYPLT